MSLASIANTPLGDVPPEKVAKLIERFPDKLTEGRSRDEAQAIHNGTDHWVSEGA
jgi:hypothetical protein